MGETIWFVGFESPLPQVRGLQCVGVPPETLFRRGGSPPRGVVLGQVALDGLDVEVVVAALRAIQERVLLCAPHADPVRLRRWFLAGFERVVAPEHLVGELCLLALSGALPVPTASSWLPPNAAPSAHAYVLASAVSGLRPLAPAEWAARLSMSCRTLERRCAVEFGETPRRLLPRFALATWTLFRERGGRIEECADAFGIDSGTLKKMLTRARRIVASNVRGDRPVANRPLDMSQTGLSRAGANR